MRRLLQFLCSFAAAGGVAVAAEQLWKPVMPDRSLFDAGAYVYERNCAICHGEAGDGRGELGVTLSPKPRDFTSGVFKYRSTPAGALPTNDDLARVIRDGLPGTAMGMFSAQLTETEIRAVAEFVKTFSPKWRRRANYAPPLVLPKLPGWFADDAAVEQHAASGRQTFLATCASCHGESGDGRGTAAAGLKINGATRRNQPICGSASCGAARSCGISTRCW